MSVHRRADGTPFVVKTMSDLKPGPCGGDGCAGCQGCMTGWERLRERIPAEVLAFIRAFHHDQDFDCAAHSEGQTCCLDLLAGSDTVDVDAPTTTKDGS